LLLGGLILVADCAWLLASRSMPQAAGKLREVTDAEAALVVLREAASEAEAHAAAAAVAAAEAAAAAAQVWLVLVK